MPRPSTYETKIKPNLKKIAILKANGIEMGDIAKTFGVTRQTLYNHMDKIDEFFDTIKKSNDIVVDKMEATLYDLALGRVQTTKIKKTYDGEGNIRGVEETIDTIAPNLGALIFSLTNLAPDTWKNKREENISFDNEDVIPAFADIIKKVRTDEANT